MCSPPRTAQSLTAGVPSSLTHLNAMAARAWLTLFLLLPDASSLVAMPLRAHSSSMMAATVLPEFLILNCRRCLIPGLLHYGIDKIACPEDSLVCLDVPTLSSHGDYLGPSPEAPDPGRHRLGQERVPWRIPAGRIAGTRFVLFAPLEQTGAAHRRYPSMCTAPSLHVRHGRTKDR